jgi:peptidyl-prolyl cis-trans isomerase D
MLETMRNSFGKVFVSLIVGTIALVFIFYGVYSPKFSQSASGSVAAKVNGEVITMREFNREYQARIQYYEQMFKGQVPDLSIFKKMGLPRQVIEDMISRKLIVQEAKKFGVIASDEEVRDKIMEMPYFKKDDKFDALTYKNVLQANGQTPAQFENLIRDEILREKVLDLMQNQVKVSEKELETEFLLTEDKRSVDYVLVDRESLKKSLVVNEKEISEFLSKPENIEKAKTYYEQAKTQYLTEDSKKELEKRKNIKPNSKEAKNLKKFEPKYLTFEQAKRQVVIDLLKDRKTMELSKMAEDVAKKLLEDAKKSDSALKESAKKYGFEFKTSEKFNRMQGIIAGLGAVNELIEEAFKKNTTLEKEPKLIQYGVNYIIAKNLKIFPPDMKNFEKEKENLAKTLKERKSSQSFREWMDTLHKKAKVSINNSIDGEDKEG